jgi:hypothetical protein
MEHGMQWRRQSHNRLLAPGTWSRRPEISLGLLTASATTPLVVLAMVLFPGPLFLPVLSLVAGGIAAIVGLFAWRTKASPSGDRVTAWDISGAFVFIACAAAILSQPQDVLHLFGQAIDAP